MQEVVAFCILFFLALHMLLSMNGIAQVFHIPILRLFVYFLFFFVHFCVLDLVRSFFLPWRHLIPVVFVLAKVLHVLQVSNKRSNPGHQDRLY